MSFIQVYFSIPKCFYIISLLKFVPLEETFGFMKTLIFAELVKHDGRMQGITKSIDLKSSSDHHQNRKDSKSLNSEQSNNNQAQYKSGELVIALDGLTIDMASIPVASPPVGVSVVPSAYDPLIAAAVVGTVEGPMNGSHLVPNAQGMANGTRPKHRSSPDPNNKAPSRPPPPNTSQVVIKDFVFPYRLMFFLNFKNITFQTSRESSEILNKTQRSKWGNGFPITETSLGHHRLPPLPPTAATNSAGQTPGNLTLNGYILLNSERSFVAVLT